MGFKSKLIYITDVQEKQLERYKVQSGGLKYSEIFRRALDDYLVKWLKEPSACLATGQY